MSTRTYIEYTVEGEDEGLSTARTMFDVSGPVPNVGDIVRLVENVIEAADDTDPQREVFRLYEVTGRIFHFSQIRRRYPGNGQPRGLEEETGVEILVRKLPDERQEDDGG